MATKQEEELLRQQREKQAGIAQSSQQQIIPGGQEGETPQQFASGKFNLFKQSAPSGEADVTAASGGAGAGGGNRDAAIASAVRHLRQMPAIDANDPASGMNALTSMLTTPGEEARLQRSSMANRRIMAVADALRHIGNIYNTVNYAPNQQFTNPVQDEQNRYERGKAVRDAANLRYYTYQQAKAAQDAKQRQWEADYSLKVADAARRAGYTEAQIKNMQDRLAQQKAYQDASLAYKKENDEANRKMRQAQYDKQNKFAQQRIGIAAQNSKNAQAYRQWRMNGGGSSRNNPIPLSTPRGMIYPNGGRTADTKQLQQLYWKAREIDQSHAGEEGYQPLIRGGVGGLMYGENDYRLVPDALRRSAELSDYARDSLGWSYGAPSDNHNMDLRLEDDEDMDEDEMNLNLE